MVRRYRDRLSAIAAACILFVAFILAALTTSPPNGAVPFAPEVEMQSFWAQGPDDAPDPKSDDAPVDPSALPSGGMPEHEHESKLAIDRPLGLMPIGFALLPRDGVGPHLVGELLPGHFTPPSQPPDLA